MQQPLRLFIIFCLLIFGALYYYAYQQDKRHSQKADVYLKRVMQDVSDWQPQSLWSHLAPAARERVSRKQLEAVLKQYRRLGGFMDMDPPRFSNLTAALSVFGSGQQLSYSFPARFEQGSALVTATLDVGDGTYRLYNFSIRSVEPKATAR
ncbi:MAG TPA: hypothetical protein DIW43_07660 [Spongiibacteraceae bacterium]|nr:hypothetical protein [Spongiibacteraceae bacterium]HCS27314.1 hypothetical protein [Spongiibacteraceae bacterium]|tara:strand:+ start:1280 stop:1732 length:453 start_codon:yes stop_codon:yes gene_type:complete